MRTANKINCSSSLNLILFIYKYLKLMKLKINDAEWCTLLFGRLHADWLYGAKIKNKWYRINFIEIGLNSRFQREYKISATHKSNAQIEKSYWKNEPI